MHESSCCCIACMSEGEDAIEGLNSGFAWTGPVEYSFPTDNAEYGGSNYANGADDAPLNNFMAVSAAQQTAVQFALDANVGPAVQSGFSVEGFTNLDITLTTAAGAEIRSGQSASANPTAYAYLPSEGFDAGGDIWFGDNIDFRNPVMGDYSFTTHLHEVGHALGLAHSHEGNSITPGPYDHVAYTVMSYRSFEGAPLTGYTNGVFGFPQTYMQLDIAALQELYGADYSANSGDTVYSWTPGNSDTLIDGIVALNPGGDAIFATLWDGGGVDTYDLSAYSTDLRLDLTEGGYSVFDPAQLALLDFSGRTAEGSIYNALMFGGNQASLIENAIGGSGDDLFLANQADNTLTGGAGTNTVSYEIDTAGVTVDLAAQTASGTDTGSDTLTGFSNAYGGDGDDTLSGTSGANELVGGFGADTLIGGDGDDILTGGLLNFVTSLPSALGMGSGTYTRPANTNNTTFANAVDITNLFALTADADIQDATTVPHVSISATGDTAQAVHFYSVTLNVSGTVLTLDIDYGSETNNGALSTDMDSWVTLYGPSGNEVAFNDDGPSLDSGSATSLDSYLSYQTTEIGTYTFAVGTYNELAPIPSGGTYELQVSVEEGTPPTDDMSSDILEGGTGNDILNGNAGIDYAVYTGGTFNDYTITDNGNGNYTVAAFGTQGTDTLSNIEFLRIDGVDYAIDGSSSGPVFTEGNDNEDGTEGADVLDGLGGNDIINGLGGDDIIFGGTGNDDLFGGADNDILNGGGGADNLDGGAGIDTASYADSGLGVTISLLANTASGSQATGDVLTSIENLTGSTRGDDLRGNNSVNVIDGGAGKDSLIGYNGNDTLIAGAGRDILNGGNGADIIDGGDSIDQARYNGSTEAVQINLLAGTAAGGQAEGDTLIDIENLFGSNHGDTLYGDGNNNKLFGHLGDDFLAANGGISKLYGGAGSDSFVLSDGFAFVMDFVDDVDQLDVSAYGFTSLADALQNVDQVGAHARFRSDGDVLFVLNTDSMVLSDDIVWDAGA